MSGVPDLETAETEQCGCISAEPGAAMLDSVTESQYSTSYSPIAPLETGDIVLKIDDIHSFKSKVSSTFHEFGGLPWRMSVKTEKSKRTNNEPFLSVYIDCHPESQSTLWNCEASVEFRLLRVSDEKEPFTRKCTNKFCISSNNWGFPSFIEWKTLRRPENGFISTSSPAITLVAHITILRSCGVRRLPNFNFSNPSDTLGDGTLVIEGKPIYVNKAYLALYSPFFNSLFYQEFAERSYKEIPLKNVSYDEFKELLEVIYPSHKPINAENVEFLLRLADQYQFEYVLQECEDFLMATDQVKIGAKLLYADRYSFSKLQNACLCELKKLEQFKELRNDDEFMELSDATKVALLERILKVI